MLYRLLRRRRVTHFYLTWISSRMLYRLLRWRRMTHFYPTWISSRMLYRLLRRRRVTHFYLTWISSRMLYRLLRWRRMTLTHFYPTWISSRRVQSSTTCLLVSRNRIFISSSIVVIHSTLHKNSIWQPLSINSCTVCFVLHCCCCFEVEIISQT